jgi:hypothetical protein
MANFMYPTLILTSSWWLATPPIDAWRLVADVAGWPRWWSALALVVPARAATGDTDRALTRPVPTWRNLAGLPLRLRVLCMPGESGAMIDLRVGGDLQGGVTWLFAPADARGTEVTCRWELLVPKDSGRLWGLFMRMLFERRHSSRMRACAGDMGRMLGCRVQPLREWSGSRR